MERLKNLRTQMKLTQQDVATILGVERSTYVKYERGTSDPPSSTLVKLADYFNTSVDYLLGRDSAYHVQAPAISDDELSILNKIRVLTPRDRAVVLSTLDTMYQTSGGEKRNSTTNAV